MKVGQVRGLCSMVPILTGRICAEYHPLSRPKRSSTPALLERVYLTDWDGDCNATRDGATPV